MMSQTGTLTSQSLTISVVSPKEISREFICNLTSYVRWEKTEVEKPAAFVSRSIKDMEQ